MKLRSIIAFMLVLAAFLISGCSKDTEPAPVYRSENFTFSEDMVMYMASYTRLMINDEMKAAGVDTALPLADQERSEGESWEDYLYEKTLESIEKILLYCEAAHMDKYTISEGMVYKASELVTYLSNLAEEAGYTAEEYIRENYGDSVTLEALETCTQMMSLCESYELDLADGFTVTEEDAIQYADENPDKFLKFNALRYTTKDKSVADKLSAAKDRTEFLKVMSGVSGYDLTDSDKNGTPDSIEVLGAVVDTDAAGEFAKGEDRAVGDTTVSEKEGKYTVTMLTSLPARQFDLIWDYRMLYLSSESSTDPLGDATSLLNQWKEKNGGEEGFSNLCSRYSDDPSAYYGGLHSTASQSEMPTLEVAAWICDSSRTAGDTTVIPAGDDGAYMLYYISGNTPRWISESVSTIKASKAQEKIDSVKDAIEEKYSFDEKAIRSIVGEIAK